MHVDEITQLRELCDRSGLSTGGQTKKSQIKLWQWFRVDHSYHVGHARADGLIIWARPKRQRASRLTAHLHSSLPSGLAQATPTPTLLTPTAALPKASAISKL